MRLPTTPSMATLHRSIVNVSTVLAQTAVGGRERSQSSALICTTASTKVKFQGGPAVHPGSRRRLLWVARRQSGCLLGGTQDCKCSREHPSGHAREVRILLATGGHIPAGRLLVEASYVPRPSQRLFCRWAFSTSSSWATCSRSSATNASAIDRTRSLDVVLAMCS